MAVIVETGVTDGQVALALEYLRHFMARGQLQVVSSLCRGEEGAFFRGKVVELHGRLTTMPRVYEQDGKGMDAIAHLHYMRGGMNFYITERDTSRVQHQAFGSSDLGYGSELGYVSIAEITRCGVELDLHFEPTRLGDVVYPRGGH